MSRSTVMARMRTETETANSRVRMRIASVGTVTFLREVENLSVSIMLGALACSERL